MSGFAIVYDTSDPRPLTGMLAAIRHRGAAVQTRRHGDLEWGVCNRATEGHFVAELGGTARTSVLLEGWVENAGEFMRNEGSASLPDAIAASVERNGVGALARLRGGFVVALFDLASNKLLLFRDVQGLRPVHYYCDGDILVAGSEVKAILAHPAVPRGIDTTVLAHLLVNGLEREDSSLALGVNKVRPGHLVEFAPGSAVTSRQLVTPFLPMRNLSLAEAEEELQRCLQEGLRQRVDNMSSVSVLLSGGIDSFVVAKTLADIEAPVRAVTAAVAGEPENEVAMARDAARHLGIQHDAWEVDTSDNLRELLRKAVTASEQPGRFGNALLLVNTFEHWGDGPKVVGSGESADTMFGGYLCRLMKRAGLLKLFLMGDLGIRLLSPLAKHLGARVNELLDLAQRVPWDHRYYVSEVFDFDCITRLLGIDPGALIMEYYGNQWREANGAPEMQRFMYLDMRTANQGCIDKKEKIAASAGLDVIHPFLMPEVCDLGFSLPNDRKIKGKNEKLVPSAIAHKSYPPLRQREKIGFSVPRIRWLQENPSLRQSVDALAEPDARVGDYVNREELKAMVAGFNSSGGIQFSDTLWIMTSVELWCQGLGI
jgi:asparagine synthase (glutamine-hydrolysing)